MISFSTSNGVFTGFFFSRCRKTRENTFLDENEKLSRMRSLVWWAIREGHHPVKVEYAGSIPAQTVWMPTKFWRSGVVGHALDTMKVVGGSTATESVATGLFRGSS